MKTFELKGTGRKELGKRSSKVSRGANEVPAVIYGAKEETIHFTVKEGDVNKLIFTPEIFLVDLDIDGKTYKAILKDLQSHPVTDKILHLDFLMVSDSKPIVIDVPVVLEGLAEGVKAGGKLSLDLRKLKVRADYMKVPEKLHIDVSHLALGKSVQVGELNFEGLELLNSKNAVVCRVQLTRAARGLAAKNA